MGRGFVDLFVACMIGGVAFFSWMFTQRLDMTIFYSTMMLIFDWAVKPE